MGKRMAVKTYEEKVGQHLLHTNWTKHCYGAK
jgi:hypothetical protein